MTQEEKQLLLIDLCARLQYGVYIENTFYSPFREVVKVKEQLTPEHLTILYNDIYNDENWHSNSFKPYLRPMSSMTEEEKDNLQSLHDIISNENYGDGYSPSAWNAITEWEDYCNARHLDYRGLIPMGLALEAPEDMYKIE